MRTLAISTLSLPLARPFAISRGTRTAVDVVRVTLAERGATGCGECTPTARYQQTSAQVVAALNAVREQVEQGATRAQLLRLLPPGSARNALDCALWRLEAALRTDAPWQQLQQQLPAALISAETLSLDTLDRMVAAAQDAVARGACLLKVKLDQRQVLEKMTAIRAVAPETTLIVDANEAWQGLALELLLQGLAALGVAMVEQPLPAGEDNVLATFTAPLPICADESCHHSGDIAGLRDRYAMINIKLDKCGGLSEALTMVETAHTHGMSIMVGCMLGSSLAMEAALPVAQHAEFVDLDGPIWLATDSPPCLAYAQGRIWLPR